ncbi:type II secretion system protein GspC [Gallaecimonas xiamenensis]|uniref:Type II secretory pathway, component EpsC n=1 Tax=Gallaecimonas xiamenensis 3-C-1 TaxID=745411 RepID=K2K3L8_9GAMM|nr:type II secretion system protein GspC [Gallaecimonas xiamenensis]EKE77554.1 type II secretory pathway, component EpsC [Gallaecimonas xiamenensis 3-C-1]
MNTELLLERASDWARRLPEKTLQRFLTLIFSMVALWLLAGLCWQLATPVPPVERWQPSQAGQGESLDLSGLSAHPLFGIAAPEQQAPVQEVVDAPETRLKLKLSGLVAESHTGSGVAIIESQGSQRAYRVGDDIKGTSAKIKRILWDRVLLDNRNQTEALMLDGKEYQPLARPAPVPAGRRPAPTSVSADQVRDSLAAAKANPASISELVRFSPSRQDDSLVGYLVAPGSKPQLFNSLGLEKGDLVKAINGYDLTDPAQAMDILSQLGTLDSLALDIERGGQAMNLSISIEQ